MYLKRLDIVGFKSFADNIRLDFEQGITSVVGPNGCGKSNIMDAIRWCLGEMSAKSLRSNLMLDVVFNGSGSRPPQNMAEVTLTFDNSDKRLPIDYTDVSITRRLFRSGESEYYINKTQCRLRDIKELFLDTGMGEDGYSSLEQGKVEWILQAKPEERRELFEEAAGVSKYRARREEALRKLDRVEIDLSRLSDIVAVTQDQIRKLENAVSKAKTYQRVREELKIMEISDWLFQITQTDQELKSTQERLGHSQKISEELNTKAHQLDTDLIQHRVSLAQLEEELLQANNILNNIDSDIKVGEERLTAAKQRERDLEKQVAGLIDGIKREESRLKELHEQKTSQTQALEHVRGEGSRFESEFNNSRGVFDSALKTLDKKKSEVKEARDMILDRAQERVRMQQQMGHLTSDMARFTSQLESVQKERERSISQIDEARRHQDTSTRAISDLQNQLSIKSSTLEDLTLKIRNHTEQEDQLRFQILTTAEEIAKLKGQIHSLREQQDQDPYLVGSQAALAAGLPGISGPLGRLFECDAIHHEVVVTSLGDHLSDLVAETTQDAERAIEHLAQTKKGRVRIWILDKLPSTSLGEWLAGIGRGNTLMSLLRTEEKFRPLLSLLCSSTWVNGTTVYGRAFINGGVNPSEWKSHALHRLPELERILQETEKRKLHLEGALQSLDQEITVSTARREEALKEMEEARIRHHVGEEELEKAAKRIQSLQEEQQVIDIELAQAKKEKIKAQYLHEECAARFQTLQAREKEDHDQLDLLQQELTELQHQHAVATADLTASKERYASFQEKLAWQQTILANTDGDIANIQRHNKHQLETIDHLKNETKNSRKTQLESQNLIDASLGKRKEAAEACAGIQSRRTSISEEVQVVETKLSSVRQQLSSTQEILQGEFIKEASLRSRTESFVQKLQDQYEMTLDAARVQFSVQTADAETLEKIKKRVANMGPINLAAPQEYQELAEKSSFLTTQQSDLLKAREDLKQVIAKINATTREHFKETFEKVRSNFRALYGQLFQGGEADLHFTNEADILSTGIDIFCQPPGKKLLHISLLSGGEKALTAIALLFAFFQVRPSPIALLDEVDAPLDEANVLRYVDMIKVFSQNSQFILITHNKRTMESANTLYGVTMEELGVSKILSARLQKAKEELPLEPASVPA